MTHGYIVEPVRPDRLGFGWVPLRPGCDRRAESYRVAMCAAYRYMQVLFARADVAFVHVRVFALCDACGGAGSMSPAGKRPRSCRACFGSGAEYQEANVVHPRPGAQAPSWYLRLTMTGVQCVGCSAIGLGPRSVVRHARCAFRQESLGPEHYDLTPAAPERLSGGQRLPRVLGPSPAI